MRRALIASALLLAACRTPGPDASAGPQPASHPASRPAGAQRADEARARLGATEAGRLVLAATEAHGGLEAWFAGGALAFRYDYVPVQGARRTSMQTVDLLGARAYHDLEAPAVGKLAFDGHQAWMQLEPPEPFAARFWALTPYYFVGMPFVLGDPGVILTKLDEDPGPAGFSGVDVVKATFAPGTGDAPEDYYILYLEQASRRLLALRYVVTYAPFFEGKPARASPEKLLVYEDLAPAGPLTLARRHTFYAFGEGHRGEKVTDATVSAVTYGAPFDPARLLMPPGATLDEALGR
jgi:hypothetical protein